MATVALVTGGARRIGRAVATHLHSLGYDLAVHYLSSEEDAQNLQDELNALRADSCRIFCSDLSHRKGASALAEALTACYKSIDLLVNNASGFAATPIETCSEEQFEKMLGSNLRGPYFLVQGVLPLLTVAGGSIVNILDVHIERPLLQHNVYGAAKAGLASLTRSLAVELAPEIRVNAVAPGAILWPEIEESYDAQSRERAIRNTPLARLGDPQDIASTVAFLAQDAAYITGQIITVDGGRGLVS